MEPKPNKSIRVVKDDKPITWLVSFPRSGNTFLRNILHDVFGIPSSEYHEDKALIKEDVIKNRVVKTHLQLNELPQFSDIDKVILLVRDGRDCMVSIAHHRKNIVDPSSDFTQNLKEAILADGNSYFGGWSTNVESWLNRADCIIRYEDLIVQPLEQVARLSAIIDLSEPNVKALPTFDKLKSGGNDVAYGKGELRDGHELRFSAEFTKRFYRRGIAGAWKDEMSEELHLLYWNKHADAMRRLGYERNGTIGEPSRIMETNLRRKMNLSVADIPDRKVLIEASKLMDKGNDGIKRYVEELVNQFEKINLDDSPWEIDLLMQGKVKPLKNRNKPKKRERLIQVELAPNPIESDHSENEIIAETPRLIEPKDVHNSSFVKVQPEVINEVENYEPPQFEDRIARAKLRVKNVLFRNPDKADSSPFVRFIKSIVHYFLISLIVVRNWIKATIGQIKHRLIQFKNFGLALFDKLRHYLIIGSNNFRHYITIGSNRAKHNAIVARNKSKDTVLTPIKDKAVMPVINLILNRITKAFELLVHYFLIFMNGVRDYIFTPIESVYITVIASVLRVIGINNAKIKVGNFNHAVKQEIKKHGSIVLRLLYGTYRNYDVLFATLPQNTIPFRGSRSAMVTTIHDFTHNTHPEYHTKDNLTNAGHGFDRIKNHKKSGIICVSEHTAKDLDHFMAPEFQSTTIWEAANNLKFHIRINADELNEAKKKYGVVAERYVVSLSTIEPRKNIITVIQAFIKYVEESQDRITKMVLIGKVGWGDKSFKQIETEIAKMPERFIFTGFVDDDDIPILLNGARVMCYVSLYEGFGLPILEAYKCGLPVICGNNSSQIEVAGPNGLLVEALDVSAISHYLDKVINDDTFYAQQRNYCLSHSEQFSWYKAAEQTLTFFHKFQSK